MKVLRHGAIFLAAGIALAALAPRALGDGGPYQYFALTPCRVIDTRSTARVTNAAFASFTVKGVCNVPAGAVAASLNVTVVAPTAAGFLGVQTFFFAFPQTDFYVERCTQYRGDLRMVHTLIHRDRGESQPLPTVYCNLGCLDYVWLDLHSKSYFDWWQAGNYMYRRDMAMEGKRRARLVAPFEIAHYRTIEDQLTPGYKAVVARFYETDFSRAPISTEDFARLCREPGLDYLVLEQHIEGLSAVQVGKLYLYSCQDVRTALRLPEVSSSDRVASRER